MTTTSEKISVQNSPFHNAKPDWHWESLHDQDVSQKDMEEWITTKPFQFKRCRLKIESVDLAYATPIDDKTTTIKITGKDNVGRSFPDDEVCVEIISRKFDLEVGDLLTGKVKGLLKRSEDACIFICHIKRNNQRLVTPVSNNTTQIYILQKQPDKIDIRRYHEEYLKWVTDELRDIEENQLLVVKVLKWERKCIFPLGVVTKVIPKEDYLMEMLQIKFNISGSPPEFPNQDAKEDPVKERKDLSKHYTVTIDKDGAKDLDDAISVFEQDDNYVVAIHVTDVASFIGKDSDEDKFARKQGKTFYPDPDEETNPIFMLSRQRSRNDLSLIPNEGRRAVSLLTVVNKSMKIIEESKFVQSYIESNEQLSYTEANEIIQKHYLNNEAPSRILDINDCVAVAYHFSNELRRWRLQGNWSTGQRKGESMAHCMVEELMNFYNAAAAEELLSRDLTRDLSPLRCHIQPETEQVEGFKKTYSNILPLSPYISHICEVDDREKPAEVQGIHIITPVFEQMKKLAASRNYHDLVNLIISDKSHPTLWTMAKEFADIQRKAEFLRSSSSRFSRLGHFGLQLNAYTSATSPMRSYLDLVVQRLLHIALSEKQTQDVYTMDEINHLCEVGMEQFECKENFNLEVSRLIKETKSNSTVVTRMAVVEELFAKNFNILLPLDGVSGLSIMYRNLKVVAQPKHNGDKSITLQWKRRAYSFKNVFEPPTKLQNTVLIPFSMWRQILRATKKEDWNEVWKCLCEVKENSDKNNVDTTKEGSSGKHFKNWEMELKLEDVLQVQIGTEVTNNVWEPTVDLLNISPSVEVCLEHARNPTKCFLGNDVPQASQQIYINLKEYQEIWGVLCRMETAYNAVEENNSVILEDVDIKWKVEDKQNIKGFFQMTQTRQKGWSLEFDLTNCFLCIRLRNQHPDKKKLSQQSTGSDVADLQKKLPFTWVAHAVPDKPKSQKEKEQKKESKDSIIKVSFKINHQNTNYVPAKVFEEGTKFTVEVIPKKIPCVQSEQAVMSMKQANDLVQKIAIGKLKNDEGEDEPLYPVDPGLGLKTLNKRQEEAVKKALQSQFTVIQGPPGTGKTVVGVQITYQYFMKNKEYEAKLLQQRQKVQESNFFKEKVPKKCAILYCGSSNKAVDIVAEQLLKLNGVLKPLRIYCDQMEMMEYSYPGSELKLCRRTLRDKKPKEELRKISLMYRVRQSDNPKSEEIKEFEAMEDFDTFDTAGYKKVLKEALQHELRMHDVILCTCSTALKPILQETMDFRQIIIDECTMAPEPEAFIPLVSHDPKQIVLLGDHKQIQPIVACARVKELGMGKSLFERYMDQAMMLNIQYRMHKEICAFPSEMFYDGLLQTGKETRKRCLLNEYGEPTSILFVHVEGEEKSFAVSTKDGNENSANELEANEAVRVAKMLIQMSGVSPENIAILTPYNAQVSKIKQVLTENKTTVRGIDSVTVCHVMKSQGSEWPYVIISTVRSLPYSEILKETNPGRSWIGKKLGFVIDPNQVNIAITRAQEGLCILGNSHLLKCSELWNKLLLHYKTQNCVLRSAQLLKVK